MSTLLVVAGGQEHEVCKNSLCIIARTCWIQAGKRDKGAYPKPEGVSTFTRFLSMFVD